MMAADSAASTEIMLARKISKATHIAAYVTSTVRSPKKNSYRDSVGVISPLALAWGQLQVNSITLRFDGEVISWSA